MTLDRNQGETFKNTGDALPSDDNVEQMSDRIVAVRGQGFYQDFIQSSIVPKRIEVAMMYAAQRVNAVKVFDHETLAKEAFEFADTFCLMEKTSLEANIGRYFRQYMQPGKLDDLIKAEIESNKDYSL